MTEENTTTEEESFLVKYKVSKKQAEMEFVQWADSMEVDCAVDDMKPEELDEFDALKKTIVLAIRKGRATINEGLDLTLTLRNSLSGKETLTFKNDFNTSALLQFDHFKDSQNMRKMMGFIGRWVKIDPKQLHKLHGVDGKFCLKVGQFFLA